MACGHEQPDGYRAAVEDVGRAYRFGTALAGHRNAKDQLLRASQAIPLNIAEGNVKGTDGSDRPRYRYRPRRRWEHRTGISPTARALNLWAGCVTIQDHPASVEAAARKLNKVTGASHWIMKDRPDEYNAIMDDFLVCWILSQTPGHIWYSIA